MDDLFLAKLDRRLERRNRVLKNNIQAWVEALDALGWCVATRGPAEGALQLSPNAAAAVEHPGRTGLTWDQLREELRAVPASRRPVDDVAMQVWAAEPSVVPADEDKTTAAPALTSREAEVLRWLREGKTNEEISIIVGCSRRTVEGHALRLYRKLGIRSRTGVYLLGAEDVGQ